MARRSKMQFLQKVVVVESDEDVKKKEGKFYNVGC